MQRIGTGDGLFVDGDRAAGIVGTICTGAWLNSLQEEVAAIVEGFGEELDAAISNQAAGLLLKATAQIQPITAVVADNALTITLNPTILDFRAAALTSGVVSKVLVPAAISLVVSSGSSLGTINGQKNRLVVLAINNGGIVELAVVNQAGGLNLDETWVLSTSAEGGAGAADSAVVVYSTTARANLPYRVVGFIESTQAAAGTWATAPSTIQGAGGQALATLSGFGYGLPVDVTASRALTTTYYNTTGKPLLVTVTVSSTVSSSTVAANLLVAGLGVSIISDIGDPVVGYTQLCVTGVVPPGASYLVTVTQASLYKWVETK